MRHKGFTLVELLITIAIIGVLATLIVAGVNIARKKAKVAKAQHDIAEIYSAISILANDTNVWSGQQPINVVCTDRIGGCPLNNEICGDTCPYGLASSSAGIVANDGSYTGWRGPYMRKMPIDSWGNEYFFDTDYRVNVDDEPCDTGEPACSDVVAIGSYGPDGSGNNLYNGDDIIKIITK